MKDVAELLRAVGSLLWPILALWVFFAYKGEIRTILRRVKKGKILGTEIELEDSLKELERSAKETEAAIPADLRQLDESAIRAKALPAELRFDSQLSIDVRRNLVSNEVEDVLQEAGRSPKAALLLLASKCEKQLRDLLFSTGWHGGKEIRSMSQGFDILQQLEILQPNVANSVRLFSEMRNRLIHGYGATDDEILRAIDSGITILKALRSLPYGPNVVHHPCAELFSDPEAKNRLNGVCGLMLEARNSNGDYSIFPTTRKGYQRGQRLSWEWDNGKQYGETWYKDPDSGEIKRAWLGSMEFAGRNLDDL